MNYYIATLIVKNVIGKKDEISFEAGKVLIKSEKEFEINSEAKRIYLEDNVDDEGYDDEGDVVPYIKYIIKNIVTLDNVKFLSQVLDIVEI